MTKEKKPRRQWGTARVRDGGSVHLDAEAWTLVQARAEQHGVSASAAASDLVKLGAPSWA